jgi:hypothetical protein
MLEVASRARAYLGDAAERLAAFARAAMTPDGGFRGRDGMPDLYYAPFGIDCLLATDSPLPLEQVTAYLRTFKDGSQTDLVHLACLVRCWSRLPDGVPPGLRAAVPQHVETCRSPDGGYGIIPDSERGSVYGCFLAYSAYCDAETSAPDTNAIAECVRSLQISGKGYAIEADYETPSTNATAAAVVLCLACGQAAETGTLEWLLARQHSRGGFTASPNAPGPDLVSTAAAVFALRAAGMDLTPLREPCRDFVAELWDESGGFCGHWTDNIVDCEHTFYAMLTLGSLEVGSSQYGVP